MGILVKVFFIKEKKSYIVCTLFYTEVNIVLDSGGTESTRLFCVLPVPSQSPLHLESESLVSDEDEEEDDEEESELELLALRRDGMA